MYEIYEMYEMYKTYEVYLHGYTGRWIPYAFSGGKVGVHVLLGAWLYNLHPFHSAAIEICAA